MADLRDFTGKNRKFTGTIGERISIGTTGERDDSTFGAGTLRFNTTSNLMEYYTGTEWKSIDAPPTITTFNVNGGSQTTSTFIDRTLSGNATFVILGSLFSAGANITFLGTAGTNITASTVTVNTSNQITATAPHSSFLNAQEPYGIRITNISGLSATLEACLSVDSIPVFNTAAGSLGTIFDSTRSSYTLSSAAATDPEGDTITYSITSGALPTGLSISSSTGAITGTASAVGTDTTSTFTVSAATASQTATRSFSILVKAPAVAQITSTGSSTFAVPAGITAVDVLVVAGGGSSGRGIPTNVPGGGGGAGGLIFRPGFPVTPGGTVSVIVGSGGPNSFPSQQGVNGQDSVFGTLTAKGGGAGAGWQSEPAQAGGSGGGGGAGTGIGIGGGGTQPSQPGNSGTFGFGNPGGNGTSTWTPGGSQNNSSGGGGGAGGSGGGGSGGIGGNGGQGRPYSISGSSVFYAGGGGGGAIGIGGQGGGGNGAPQGSQSPGTPGTDGRGGGGGGPTCTGDGPTPSPTLGGNGIVIVSF